MAIYIYLRVSTDAQDVENQRHGILEYCASHGIEPDAVYEDTVSGRTDWRNRKIGQLLSAGDKGDVVLVSEVSRLARSTLQVLEILKVAAERQISLVIVKNGLRFDNSMQAKITATILGLAAEIERDFISMRTQGFRTRLPYDDVLEGAKFGTVDDLPPGALMAGACLSSIWGRPPWNARPGSACSIACR
jgi:DNA invertase Pin-like site-specific DNA recombinase